MNKLHITIILGALSIGAMAQKSDSTIGSEVVNVIGTYTPTISDAFKVKETPSFDDETVTDKEEINYSIMSFPVASTFVPAKGNAQAVEKAKKEKYFSNYALLGVGNYGTVLGELYLTHNLSRNQYVGAMLKHHSSQGGIKDVVLDDFFYDTSVDLNYSEFDKEMSWSADIGYRNQVVNWYGLPIDYVSFTENQINSIDELQTYHSLYLGGKINKSEGIFNGAEVYFKRFWDVHQSAENRFWVKPSFEVRLGDFDTKVDVVADYVGTSFDKDYYNVTSLEYSYFNLGVQPSIMYYIDDLSLKAGVGLFYSSGKAQSESDSKFFVYPQVQASYRAVGDLMVIYAGAEGTLQQNSYSDLVAENPFISPGQTISPTDRQYDIYVGVKGKLASNIAYNARGSFMNEKGKLFFGSLYDDMNSNTEGYAFGNSFFTIYDDVNTVEIFGELKADINKNISVFANAKFNSYATETQDEAWYLPTIRFSAGTDIAISEKLSLNANLFYVGERKAMTLYELNPKEVTLDGYFDANIGANYRLNERLSLFLKLNNIADQKYEKWINFPVQGIQVLGGASYKFDF